MSSERPLSDHELAAWRGFLRTHASLLRELDAELVRAHGLTVVQYEVLIHLYDAGGRRRMAHLAEDTLVSRSGLTRIIDQLERAGFVERERCEDDARGFFAVLTPKGRAKRRSAGRTHVAGVRSRFLDRLSAAQRDALIETWRAIDASALEPSAAELAATAEVPA